MLTIEPILFLDEETGDTCGKRTKAYSLPLYSQYHIDQQRAEIARLENIICNKNFAELMKINVLAELAKARAEERERCAKIAEEWAKTLITHNAKLALGSLAETIRALKDSE